MGLLGKPLYPNEIRRLMPVVVEPWQPQDPRGAGGGRIRAGLARETALERLRLPRRESLDPPDNLVPPRRSRQDMIRLRQVGSLEELFESGFATFVEVG